jgi:hypothetical protein
MDVHPSPWVDHKGFSSAVLTVNAIASLHGFVAPGIFVLFPICLGAFNRRKWHKFKSHQPSALVLLVSALKITGLTNVTIAICENQSV